jgi:hypothetical protein
MQQPNLFEAESQQKEAVPLIDPQIIRKLNLLTQKERPFCGFCNAKCGFSWYDRQDYSLCTQCFEKKNYPEEVSALDFKVC